MGADIIIGSPDECRAGSDLAPEVSSDHLCSALAAGAINQNTGPTEIKDIIRVVIIVLINTVPENQSLCASWVCPFVVHCIAALPGASVNRLLVSALHLFSLCLKKLEASKERLSPVSWGLRSPSPRLWEFSQTVRSECVL